MIKFNPQKYVRAHFVRTRSFSSTGNEIRRRSTCQILYNVPFLSSSGEQSEKSLCHCALGKKTVLGSLHADRETSIAKRQNVFLESTKTLFSAKNRSLVVTLSEWLLCPYCLFECNCNGSWRGLFGCLCSLRGLSECLCFWRGLSECLYFGVGISGYLLWWVGSWRCMLEYLCSWRYYSDFCACTCRRCPIRGPSTSGNHN